MYVLCKTVYIKTYDTPRKNISNISSCLSSKVICGYLFFSCDGAKMGQNMFMSSGSAGFPTMDLRGAIDAWFSEKAFYHYNSKACDDDEMCGHYTQVHVYILKIDWNNIHEYNSCLH